ncbi:DUF4247 domain-containing protein [Bacillus sp. REN10]|uniref:DUF4247 domain-containing protein n=1 Tax=Bacillus sp. REN10 TaxID=2782541 RepID=UPI00193C7FA0|nr:DUF4247 domain-containing protein [Bacillus sp. REN10]
MKKRMCLIPVLLAALIAILSGCGNGKVEEYISEQYMLIDVVQSPSSDKDNSYVYQAENQSVPDVAKELIGVEKPEETGKYVNGKQVLIYDHHLIILTKDPDNEADTLIEVATEGFVRDYYRPSFFQGMLIGHVLTNMFGKDWDHKQRNRCGPTHNEDCYEGYGSSGGGYYGNWGSSSSGRGSTFRGGGPGEGK